MKTIFSIRRWLYFYVNGTKYIWYTFPLTSVLKNWTIDLVFYIYFKEELQWHKRPIRFVQPIQKAIFSTSKG